YVGGASSVDLSAALGIESTTKGFLPPRMTTIQRDAINSPAKGLMVFDNTLNSLFTYNGTLWVSAEASANTWNIAGNTTINETTDFIGSVNAADVVVKTQNAEVMRVTKDGRVGVGTAGGTLNTSAKLEVKSTSQGFLPPRMSTVERNAIASPAVGLVVFDTNRNNLFLYAGMWVEMGVPLGTVEAFYGTTIPEGWLLCNGSNFDAGAYSELNAFLRGNTLPNLGGMFLRGKNNGRTDGNQDPDGERTIGNFQNDVLKAHTHTYIDISNNLGAHSAATGFTGGGGAFTAVTRTSNSFGGAETRSKNVVVNYIIKAK
ncbi:MAG: tail fiber protein, partial [Marinifilaceae bacterium]